MTTPRRLGAGPPTRVPPLLRGRAVRFAWVLLALASFALEGCQSLRSANPFGGSGCNGCGSGGGGGLFHRRNRSVEMYEAPLVTDGVEVEPGAIIADPAPSATIITPSSPGSAAPSVESPSDLQLDPLPEPTGPARSSTGSGSSGSNSSSRANTGSGSNKVGLRSTPLSSGDESRTARTDPAARPDRDGPAPMSLQVLDDLPRPAGEVVGSLDPPGARDDSPPISPAADPVPGPTSTSPTPDPSPSSAAMPPITLGTPAGAAPGLRFFSTVNPRIAGGSYPDAPGYEFLTQKGYRTILDLRDTSQIRPDDLADIHHWGLRHVMLPLKIEDLTPEAIRKFEEEIVQEAARPLYFCDSDGSRAATIWYIHRINVDKVDPDLARRDAEQLGPLSPESLARAQALVQIPSAPAAPVQPTASAEPAAPASPEPADAATSVAATEQPPSRGPGQSAESSAPTSDPDPDVADNFETASDSVDQIAEAGEDTAVDEPGAWRPYAALFLTLLVIPLAYWSGSPIALTRKALALASPRSASRRLRSLPPSSGA